MISSSNADLGTKRGDFTYQYSVTDPDGDTVNVVEKIDGKTIATKNAITLGATQTLSVSGNTFTALTNAKHTITITATDSAGNSAVRTLTFTKSIAGFVTSIANAVIALIAAIITAFVIPWIRSKTTAAQFEKIKMWVTVAVEAAEQLYTGSGRGAEKKAYVVEFLNSKGFKIDAETLDKLIEAAVFNLPDYFVVNGIPAEQINGNKE